MWDAINTKTNEFISNDMICIDEEVNIELNLYCADSIYYADSILLKIILLPTHHIIQHPWLLYIFTRKIMEDTDILIILGLNNTCNCSEKSSTNF